MIGKPHHFKTTKRAASLCGRVGVEFWTAEKAKVNCIVCRRAMRVRLTGLRRGTGDQVQPNKDRHDQRN